MPKKHTLFPIPPESGREAVHSLLQFPGGRAESIVSTAACSPDGFWYDRQETEWVSVLEGWAVLGFPGGRVTLRAGECLTIPAHLHHRVEETSAQPPCRRLCIFYQD